MATLVVGSFSAAAAPPSVTLTSPPAGTSFHGAEVVPLAATASAANGIQRVEFYDGETKIGEDTTAPYTLNWTGGDFGWHTLYAVAVDGAGSSAASAPNAVAIHTAHIPGWTQTDIGDVILRGSASYSATPPTYTVNGTGGDVWGAADAFTYLYRRVQGDVTITARVASMGDTHQWAKAGVMLRETLNSNSRMSFALFGGVGANHVWRASTGANASESGGPNATKPCWVRLVRTGNICTAYTSTNGTTWTLISTQTVAMTSAVYVGLAVASYEVTQINTAKFDNVSIVSQGPTAQIVTPLNNTSLLNPTSVELTATATPGASAIAQMKFYADGLLIGQDNSAPYTCTWNALTFGTRQFTAEAVDTAGRSGYSSPVSVTMNMPNRAGWRGEYFNNKDLTASALVRLDPTIDFDWGSGSPDSRIDSRNYSVRWSGRVRPKYSQTYTVTTVADDGVRVWVNGVLLIDRWLVTPLSLASAPIFLVADQEYDVVMEYFEEGGVAAAKLMWSSASQAEEVIPANRVTAFVPANAAPSVFFSTPLGGAAYFNDEGITLGVYARDDDGAISKVEFLADGVTLGELTSGPFLWVWPGLHGNGPHTVYARVFDNSGQSTVTPISTIQIQPLTVSSTSLQATTGPGGEAGVIYTLQTMIPAGRAYVIEWTSNMTDWNPLRSGTSTGAPIEVIDTTVGAGKRFYRARLTN